MPQRKKYKKALSYYSQIIEDLQRLTDDDPIRNGHALLDLYLNMASIYNNQCFLFRKRRNSIEYYKMAFSLAQKLYDKTPGKYQKQLAGISGKLGKFYYKTKDYKKAAEYLTLSSKLYRSFEKSIDRSTWIEMVEVLLLQINLVCKIDRDLDIASEMLDYLINSFEKVPEYWKGEVKGLRSRIDALTSEIESLRIHTHF